MLRKLNVVIVITLLLLLAGCKISGKITENGIGVKGIEVRLAGNITLTAVTDDDGYYEFSDSKINNHQYIITPSSEAYGFDPISRDVKVGSSNIENVDFNAYREKAPIVLMYHLIREDTFGDYPGLFVRPDDFEEEMAYLVENGYKALFSSEYGYSAGKNVIITFDDGYIDNYTIAFPILKKYNLKATIFMFTGQIYSTNPNFLKAEQIKEMSDSGLIQFQSHAQDHVDLTTIPDKDLKKSFEESSTSLKEITGVNVTTVAYPYGAADTRVMKIAAEFFKFGYLTGNGTTTNPYGLLRQGINRDTSIECFAEILKNNSDTCYNN